MSTSEQRKDHISVRLLTQHAVLARDGETWIALQMRHDPHWHTYWQFPGDSGLPTKIKFDAPAGVEIGPLQFQAPIPLEVGGIHNIGFEGESWVFAPLKLTGAVAAAQIQIKAKASWLICKEECIPGDAEFVLDLPLSEASVDSEFAADFGRELAKRPEPVSSQASYQFDPQRKQVQFRWQPPVDLQPDQAWLFVGDEQLAATAPSVIESRQNQWITTRAQHDSFVSVPNEVSLVLRDKKSNRAWQYLARSTAFDRATWIETQSPSSSQNIPANAAAVTNPSANMGFLTALMFAFVGGLILNLMPCVLPVLSIKLLSLLEQSPTQVRTHAVFYSLGVWLSFMAIGGLLLVLRAGGEKLGWGFQLQSPLLVGALALLMFALALSLSGLIQIGAGLAQLSQYKSNKHGALSAFGSGVLACVVASPCTAPLMAGALGYALVQPAWISLSVLSALAIGFAAPMLVLAVSPSLARFLPKPGSWMQTLKHVLAVPLYLSAIWLAWIFGQQRGVDALGLLLIAALLLALGLIWREQLRFDGSAKRRLAALALALLAALPWYQASINPSFAAGIQNGTTNSEIAWQSYSESALSELRAQNQPVLVEMTAAWCVTCKVNERVAMSGESFAQALRQFGVKPMKGDWTNRDAAITRYLESFGISGVPLVVVYGKNNAVEVLPQLLTPGIVRDALQRAANPNSKP